MAYALLFPGQASQQVGMGSDFRDIAPGRTIYEMVDRITGLAVSDAIASGPLDRLTNTLYAQPAVVATSLAIFSALRSQLGSVGAGQAAFCAGHSVGELAAVSAAGAIGIQTSLRLVGSRARLMAEACGRVDGTMAAVIGLGEEALRDLCAEASTATGVVVNLANLNAPGQLVESGHRAAVTWLAEHAAARGARRVIALTVGGPFHSVYMRAAAEAFAHQLATAPIRRPGVPVVLNQTVTPTVNPEEIRRELAEQIASPVRWSTSLQTMASAGCEVFVEVGPGRVLAGLVRRTPPEARVLGVHDRPSLEQAADVLADLPAETVATGNTRHTQLGMPDQKPVAPAE